MYSFTLLVLVATLNAPGFGLSLLVIAASLLHRGRQYAIAGIGFMLVFTSAFFSGIEVGMLTKSAWLLATGVVLLDCRWWLLRITRDTRELSHA